MPRKKTPKRIVAWRPGPFWGGVVSGIVYTLLAWLLTNAIQYWYSAHRTAGTAELVMREACLAELYSKGTRTFDPESVCPAKGYFSGETTVASAYMDLFAPDAWIVDVQQREFARGSTEIEKRLQQLPPVTLKRQITEGPRLLADGSSIALSQTMLELVTTSKRHDDLDRWVFRKVKGQWLIESFEYDLPH